MVLHSLPSSLTLSDTAGRPEGLALLPAITLAWPSKTASSLLFDFPASNFITAPSTSLFSLSNPWETLKILTQIVSLFWSQLPRACKALGMKVPDVTPPLTLGSLRTGQGS